jgi:NTE family protein
MPDSLHLPLRKTHRSDARPPFEQIALLLQGGGALGAYQGGVYQALAEARVEPDWVAGISIGGVNAALIAGNPPEHRVDRLREFWCGVTEGWSAALANPGGVLTGDMARTWLNGLSAGFTLLGGVPGFFAPRMPPPWLAPAGSMEATSYYDTAPLRSTLERLIDFDRINGTGAMRLSVGAVNVRSGNFVYFDNSTHVIGPQHVMASGALPPGFPAVEIEGERYWDGGLVSNTPLQWVLNSEPRRDTLAFQVDLWSARGEFPKTIAEVMTRQKEIQFSSRTRASSDRFKNNQKLRKALAVLLDKLPPDLKDSPEVAVLCPLAVNKVYNLIQLICLPRQYESDSKDYEFSRRSMEDHWQAGYIDTVRTLRHPEVLRRPENLEGVLTFDVHRDGRE